MKTISEHTLKARLAHHRALEVLAQSVNCHTDGLILWRKLRRLETKVHKAAEAYSNDATFGLELWETVQSHAKQQATKIFGGTLPKGVFINGDPRGHSLKLDCDVVGIPEGMYRDRGGNGILAADIN